VNGADEGAESAEGAAPVDETLIEAAATYGFSKDQAEGFGERLPQVLAAMDRQAAQLIRDEMAAGKGERTQAEPQQQTQQANQQQAASILKKLEKLELKLNKDDYDPETHTTLSSITGKLNEYADTINQQQELMSALAQLVVEQHQKDFDHRAADEVPKRLSNRPRN
jgi:hypothetical protein